jgi:hypothetical protein
VLSISLAIIDAYIGLSAFFSNKRLFTGFSWKNKISGCSIAIDYHPR